MKKSKHALTTLAAMTAAAGGGSEFGEYYITTPNGSTHKNYKEKNKNIEYYFDENGNIRRRKIK